MSKLMILTLVPLAILLPLHASLVWAPSTMREGLRRFPRHRWIGWALAGGAVVWAAWLLRDMPLGRFDYLKQFLVPAAVVFAGLVLYTMEELLAPRALGALLLLYPAPLLEAARLHESPWSVVMSLVAYVMVVKGMALLLSPYLFRKATERVLATDTACRVIGSVGLAFDAALLLLALVVY
ncbi:MAG TPA: hypothetical protein DCS43_08410 [Verrucomicrobia bacterium]|nr:hypothetical protein [Verrucomicrobiota bacterium]